MPRKRIPSAARQRLADDNAERLSAAKDRARKLRALRKLKAAEGGRSVAVPETASDPEKFSDAKLVLVATRENIDEQWVLREAVRLYQRCMADVRPALHPKHRTIMRTEDGEPLFTFNANAAVSALRLIGSVKSVSAFEENIAVTDHASLVGILNEGRARVRHLRGEAVDAAFDEVAAPKQITKEK